MQTLTDTTVYKPITQFADVPVGMIFSLSSDSGYERYPGVPRRAMFTKINDGAQSHASGKTYEMDSLERVQPVRFVSHEMDRALYYLSGGRVGKHHVHEYIKNGEVVFALFRIDGDYCMSEISTELFDEMLADGWITPTPLVRAQYPCSMASDTEGHIAYATPDDFHYEGGEYDIDSISSPLNPKAMDLLRPSYPHLRRDDNGWFILDQPYLLDGGWGGRNGLSGLCHRVSAQIKEVDGKFLVTFFYDYHQSIFFTPTFETALERVENLTERLSGPLEFTDHGRAWAHARTMGYDCIYHDTYETRYDTPYSRTPSAIQPEIAMRWQATSAISTQWNPYDRVRTAGAPWSNAEGETDKIIEQSSFPWSRETFRINTTDHLIERLDLYGNVVASWKIATSKKNEATYKDVAMDKRGADGTFYTSHGDRSRELFYRHSFPDVEVWPPSAEWLPDAETIKYWESRKK